jgi:hypothetical protein
MTREDVKQLFGIDFDINKLPTGNPADLFGDHGKVSEEEVKAATKKFEDCLQKHGFPIDK